MKWLCNGITRDEYDGKCNFNGKMSESEKCDMCSVELTDDMVLLVSPEIFDNVWSRWAPARPISRFLRDLADMVEK